MNAGIAPGVTNLLAAGLLKETPEHGEVDLVVTVTTDGYSELPVNECPGGRTRNARTAAPNGGSARILLELLDHSL
jgi:hypothetical protein